MIYLLNRKLCKRVLIFFLVFSVSTNQLKAVASDTDSGSGQPYYASEQAALPWFAALVIYFIADLLITEIWQSATTPDMKDCKSIISDVEAKAQNWNSPNQAVDDLTGAIQQLSSALASGGLTVEETLAVTAVNARFATMIQQIQDGSK